MVSNLLMKAKYYIHTELELQEKITKIKKVKTPVFFIKVKIMGQHFFCNDKKVPVLNKEKAFKTNYIKLCQTILNK